LRQEAEREPYEDGRRHLLDLAAQYQRAADEMAPPAPQEGHKQQTVGRISQD